MTGNDATGRNRHRPLQAGDNAMGNELGRDMEAENRSVGGGGERVSAPEQEDDHRSGSDEDDEEGMRFDGRFREGMMTPSGTLDRDYKRTRRQTDEERTATTPNTQGREHFRYIIHRYSAVL